MTAKLTLLLCVGGCLVLGGCLGERDERSRIAGGTLTVYASLPRHGVSAPAAAAVAAGERLALRDAGGRAGGRRIRLVTLDASTAGERVWQPDRVSENAERAADDDTTIAYLGELDYGASAVSVPITNEAGILQVSPGDGLTSLTRRPPGRPRAGPERYYPSGERTFLRLVPSDLSQAETLLAQARAAGVTRLAILYDQEIYGRELAAQIAARARRDGPDPVASEEYRGAVDEIPDIVRSLAAERPNGVVYAGVAGPGSGRMLATIDAHLPGAPVYATAGLLARDPRRPVPAAPRGVTAYSPIRPAATLPAAGRRTLRRLRTTYGPSAARPEALYGYEAMRLVLEAVRRAGPDREGVVAAARDLRVRHAAFGAYRVRATGDVEAGGFALYALRDGRFVFERMLR